MDAAVVGDDAHLVVELVGLAVERHDFLALLGQARVDLAFDLVGVVDVERARAIERDQVRDVDER